MVQKTKKIKPFPPSLKEKTRYLLIQGNGREFERILMNFLGVEGFSKLNFKILSEIKFKKKNFFLAKINASELIKVRSSLCVFENEIKIIKIYGTIKKVKKENSVNKAN